MSIQVDSTEIERIVGALRHDTLHLGRAVSVDETVFILHSGACIDAFDDLRVCPFSLALDNGIDPEEWIEDKPVVLGITRRGRLTGDVTIGGRRRGPGLVVVED